MAADADLLAAYRATTWVIDAPGGPVPLRLNDTLPTPSLPCPFGIITAYNPASVPQSWEENEAANLKLQRALNSLGAVHLRTLAQGTGPEAEHWAEPGFAVAGLALADLVSLGQRFGQNAIVWVDAAGQPTLVVTRPGFFGRQPGESL